MKKKFLISLMLSGLLFSNIGYTAQTKEPITADNIVTKLNSLKAGETKEFLGYFVKSCMAKDLAGCHLAWYDLQDSGLKFVATHEDGFTYSKWMFLKNADATDIYDFVINGLGHKSNMDGWDLGVGLDKQYKDVLTYVPARYALFDPGMRQALVEVLQANLSTYDIQYNVSQSFNTPREEWYKLLALSFMSRKDPVNAYKVLDALTKYGKIKHSTAGYNDLSLAIQTYFQKTGVTK